VRCLHASPLIDGNVFTDNHSANHAGGIYSVNASPRIRDCLFVANTAGSGTGIYLDERSRATIERCEFRGNEAVGLGGGITIELESAGVIRDCLFENNSAGDGGAICVSAATAEIRRCRMVANTASFGGGLSLMSAGDVTVEHCAILENEATFAGGGAYISSSTFEVDGCVFEGNSSELNGGAAWLYESTGGLTGSAIRGNGAGDVAGGIYVTRSTLTVEMGELVDNGLAVYVEGDPPADADARYNWWGHASGPYHPLLNPEGEGDEVGDHVVFSPWLQVAGGSPSVFAGGRGWAAPSPFRPSDSITFSLAEPSPVSLRVHDASGRLVRVLCDRLTPAGHHELCWDGRDERGRPASSAVYLIRFRARDQRGTRRVVLFR